MAKTSCSNPIVHLIGNIAVDFATIEFYLEGAIWILIAGGNKDVRRCAEAITAEMSFDRKVHAFASLYKLRFPAEADDATLKELVADLFEIQNMRNTVLHGTWSYSPHLKTFTHTKASAKAKHGLRRKFAKVSPAELRNIYDAIVDVGSRLGNFAMDRLQARLKPSGETA